MSHPTPSSSHPAEPDLSVGVVLCDPQAEHVELWWPRPLAGDAARVDLTLTAPDGTARPVGEAEAHGTDRLRFAWPADLPRHWWSVNEPSLYRLTGSVDVAGQTHPLDLTFGLRWWSTRGEQVLLNGRPFYVRGCIRGISAHDHPNLTGLPDEAAHEKSIRATRTFGFNFVRWHSTIPGEDYLDAADRLGLAVQVELGFTYREGQFEFDEARWERTIRRVSRHPSVAVYCLGNEIREAGKYPQMRAMIEQARRWDPAPLVMDNCGWGQPDRPGPDVYCQHVAYFFPYGDHADMFDRIQGFDLEGFVQDPPPAPGEPGSVENPLRPTTAHEVCHYIAMRDLDSLEAKWRRWKEQAQPGPDHPAAELPWWVDALRRFYREKGIDQEEPQLRRASQKFQGLAQRHVLESIRLNPTLQGFQMLQMADCWKFENSNGLIDAFDDPIHWDPADFRRFNADTAILVKFGPERSFAAGSTIRLPASLSHYGSGAIRSGVVGATLSVDGRVVARAQDRSVPDLEPGRLHPLPPVELEVPALDAARQARLTVTLTSEAGTVESHWNTWLLPTARQRGGAADPRLIRELTPEVLASIARGENRLWLYRPEAAFDPAKPRPAMDFAGRRELLKGVIWDRGDNLGAMVHDHPALGDLPHEGFADWQIAPLLHHGVKINLDRFPVPVRPIIQGVDRPVRDRMEVKKLGKPDLQPAHTCRRWGWLFELAIGQGRLLVCGLNLDSPTLAGPQLLANLLGYLDHPTGQPSATLDPQTLADHLTTEARTEPHREPPMTEYWLRDKDPVETTLFWQELGINLR